MGRSIRKRQDAAALKALPYAKALAKPPPKAGVDIRSIRDATVAGLRPHAIRDPDTWPCQLRTRDPARIALAVARYAFAAYPVPYHLERVWLGGEGLTQAEVLRRKEWYLCVAQGRSLHKAYTGTFLTKRETHRFLAPPSRMPFGEALWYAIARTYCDDHGICLRVSKSKAARATVTPFWKDAARFLCEADIPLNEINDLVDYLVHRLNQSASFSLKGRTPSSMRAGMVEWHRDLARRARVAGGNWGGHPIEGYEFLEVSDKPGRDTTWTIVQILSGNDLADEGSAQHHCVATYKSGCMSGNCSIWSLRRTNWKGMERALTMEVRAGRIVQIRGFANRLANSEEMRHVRRWAETAGLDVHGD